eukprot:944518_1
MGCSGSSSRPEASALEVEHSECAPILSKKVYLFEGYKDEGPPRVDIPESHCDQARMKEYETLSAREFREKERRGKFTKPDSSVRDTRGRQFTFIVDKDGYVRFYDFSKHGGGIGGFGHTSLLPGPCSDSSRRDRRSWVLYAGNFWVDKTGHIAHWSNNSGHFKPDGDRHEEIERYLGLKSTVTFTNKRHGAHQAILNMLEPGQYFDADNDVIMALDAEYSHSSAYLANTNGYDHYIGGLDHSHSRSYGEYHNGLLIGGVVGAGSIVMLLVVLCIGLAVGVLVCFVYQQKKELEERKEMNWRQE